MRCVLRPDLGGSVAGLWLGDEPVLRSRRDPRSAREGACFPLVPFSNRIAQARLHWQDTTYELKPNFAPEPHAMHGIAWQRAWQLTHHDAVRASMRMDHAGDEHWPFEFACEQLLVIDEGSLRISLEFTNTGRRPCPVGMGWHPYVVKRPGARVCVPASAMWQTGVDSLPTSRVASTGLEADCDALSVNHVFDLSGDVTLGDARLKVRIHSSLTRLLASTHPSKDFIALEPVSHVPDSFNRSDPQMGTLVLQPGQIASAWMVIAAERAA